MNPIRQYTTVDRGYPYRLRGTQQQSNTGLLFRPGRHRDEPRGLTTSTGTLDLAGLALSYVSMQNRSAASIVMGIGVRIPNRYWIAGQWDDDAGTPFTDDTTDAQDTGADDFALESTTNSDGYVIASRVPFNAISINVGTADTGGSPVRAARYTDPEGDGWTNFANLFIQDAASAAYSTGEQLVVFGPPTDWGTVASGGLSGIPEGYYAVNVRATTAPATTAATANAIEIFRLYELTEAVADNNVLNQVWSPSELVMEPVGDALVALFGTASLGNRVTAAVRSA